MCCRTLDRPFPHHSNRSRSVSPSSGTWTTPFSTASSRALLVAPHWAVQSGSNQNFPCRGPYRPGVRARVTGHLGAHGWPSRNSLAAWPAAVVGVIDAVARQIKMPPRMSCDPQLDSFGGRVLRPLADVYPWWGLLSRPLWESVKAFSRFRSRHALRCAAAIILQRDVIRLIGQALQKAPERRCLPKQFPRPDSENTHTKRNAAPFIRCFNAYAICSPINRMIDCPARRCECTCGR